MTSAAHEGGADSRSWTGARALAAASGAISSLAEATGQQRDRWFLWAPVWLSAGVGVYFALPIEPHWMAFAVCALVLAALSAAALAGRLQPLSLFLALIVAGVLLGKLRTEMVRHPELLATTGVVELSGWVDGVETLDQDRLRLAIRVDALAGIRPEATPPRLRVNIDVPAERPQLGEYIRLRAWLMPLPGPVEPGGYDFARALWFQGIGATGAGIGAPLIDPQRSLDLGWSARPVIEAVRGAIRDRIDKAVPEDLAGFTSALIIGDRAGIPEETQTALQISGLAHILSISGLHMSLMAGSVFWLLRAGLALVPGLALNRPIKKWASCGTLLAGFGYLMISGWGVATQRSYIMLAVMCLAVLLDRPAISMRNLALAALILLIATPEAALTASFQMSFLAVMGLIAFYEVVSAWRRERMRDLWPRSLGGRLGMWLALSVLAMASTTLVASLFTSLPAAYHFNRVAPYSLLANLLALPVVSSVVMPAALVSVFAMPLGLEWLPLQVMALGIGWVTAIAHWVAGLPGAGFLVSGMPAPAALAMVLGAVWLCLWRGRLRLGGVALVLAGLAVAPLGDRPDILVERAGSNVAARNAEGLLVPVEPRRSRFAVEKWLQQDGDMATMEAAAERPGWTCSDERACRMALKGRQIAYLHEKAEGPEVDRLCRGVDIVIAAFPLRRACRDVPLRIDRFDVWRNGAYALFIDDDDIEVTTAAELRGARPWATPPVARASIREPGYEETWE